MHETTLRSLGLAPNAGVLSESHVVEFVVRIEGSKFRRLYTVHRTGYRRVTLLVGSFARIGDEIEVLGARKYAIRDFQSDFENCKLGALRLLVLQDTDKGLRLRVGQCDTFLESPFLSAHYSKAVLRARLECTKTRIGFGFDGETATAWFNKSQRITSVTESRYGIEFEYQEANVRRRLLEPTPSLTATTRCPGDAAAWTWRDVADWIDTEGLFAVYPQKRSYSVQVVQKERKPLKELASFVSSAGIPSRVRKNKRGIYIAVVTGLLNVAKLIRETEPYIKTKNKQRQIKRFKDSLKKDKKTWKVSTLAARGILGGLP